MIKSLLAGLLGVRAVLFDLGLKPSTERVLSTVLTLIGVGVVTYGIWLSATIVSQGRA